MTDKAYEGLSLAIKKNSSKLAEKILQKPGTLFTDVYFRDYILLIQALQRGRKEIVELLLRSNCRVQRDLKSKHIPKSFYCTPLYYAVRLGDVKIVSSLLNKGAVIEDRDRNEESSLLLAYRLHYFDIVKEMLSKYYFASHNHPRAYHQVEIRQSKNDTLTAYYIACLTNNESAISNFIETGIFLKNMRANYYWYKKDKKLHFAVDNEYVELIEVLAKSGADITERNEEGITPLHLALLKFTKNSIHKCSCQKMLDYMLDLHTQSTENCYDNYGISHFHIACMRDNKKVVQIFLDQGIDVNKPIPVESPILSNYTPLHIAVDFHCFSVILLLLMNNADIDVPGNEASTPLHLLFEIYLRKESESIEKIIDLMLSKNRDHKNFINQDGLSYFHIASSRNNLKLMELFLKNGVEVNQSISLESKVSPGYTPLHFAVQYRKIEAVRLLLEHNADVNIPNGENLTSLHLAWKRKHRYVCREKTDTIIDLLLSAHKDTSVNPSDTNGLTHFHIACTRKNTEKVQEFLKNGANINEKILLGSRDLRSSTPLHCAVKYNRAEIVKVLLEHGADVNAVSKLAWTPLRVACDISYNKTYELLRTEIQSYEKIEEAMSEELFSSYGHPSDRDSWYQNRADHIKIVELLLKYNSDKDIKDRFNEPLLIQVYKKFKFEKISNVLFDHISRRVSKHIEEILLKEFLIRRREIVKLLIQHDVDTSLKGENDYSILHVLAEDTYDDSNVDLAESILSKGADVNIGAADGLTPLHIAISVPHCHFIEVLLNYNANVNCTCTNYRWTPLHLASQHFIKKPNKYEKIILWLVDRRADIDAKDKHGITPLFFACTSLPIVAWQLLDYGADINVQKNDGMVVTEYMRSKQTMNNMAYATRYVKIIGLIRNHILKLKEIGFKVNKKLEKWFDMFMGKSGFPIAEHESKSYRDEIDKMKSIRIDNYTSLYDLIFKDLNKMASYVENNTFKDIIESVYFETSYPSYNYLLKIQFKKGVYRRSILQPGRTLLVSLLPINLPDLCIEKILTFFNDKELEEFLKVNNETAKDRE